LTARDVAAINKRYNDRVAMQLSADDVLGQITSELQHLGELSNTYIFVTSDNGWMHGEHRITADKLVPYEESVHMPMFVTGPGITPGSHSSDLTSMVDLYATFDAIAGGDEQRDGRSMLPIFSGGSNGRRQDLIENLSTNPRRPLNSKSKGPPDYFGLVDGQYKYVHYFTGEQELYDLSVDPDETTNLVASDPSVVAALRAKLGALEHCSGAGCRTADSAP
jgi:arylsulfatase A-like enzyme